MTSVNSFGSRATLDVAGKSYTIYRLDALSGSSKGNSDRLPFSLKILLENLLRNEDGAFVKRADVETMANWDVRAQAQKEIAFRTARVLLQDFTGVPAVVDLAAMRDALSALGGDPQRINPLQPVDLVIDHSVQVDEYGTDAAFLINTDLEFERNIERYVFLRWGQDAFKNFRVVPPGTGICHQVNLEYLGKTVFVNEETGEAYCDSLVGTDSHTTMINGLGVLGWGVGGIEAEAAMLGQPLPMLTPRVVGFRLSGELPEGSTATDLVLRVTELLRAAGVVGAFVEFHGPGVATVPVENRATIGNMSPEYGSTCAIFPIDDDTPRYLRFTGRPEDHVALVEAYAKEQGLWHEPDGDEPVYSEELELDLSTVVPSLAGPARPQDRVPLDQSKARYREALDVFLSRQGGTGVAIQGQALPNGSHDQASALSFPASDPPADSEAMGPAPTADAPSPELAAESDDRSSPVPVRLASGASFEVDHGSVVIAAITSCTNTSNPSVMVAAGLLAAKAVERGLGVPPWVKTSLAPGSKVVVDYLDRAGLTPALEKLGFNLVGFGCTTCIGNSGPLLPEISAAVADGDLSVVSVLSGNRNFEGRINPDVRMNYLASPPLVVAYALAGTMDVDLYAEPLGHDPQGSPVFLRDLWPTSAEVEAVVGEAVRSDMFRERYADVLTGDERWRALPVPGGDRFAWDAESTYVRRPPYFDGMAAEPGPLTDVTGARALAVLGDSVTTDHISPAGSIREDGPAGRWLIEHGVAPEDFNSYGARRGNHEVMIRGTFANIRLRNLLAPGTEGGVTVHLPDGEQMTIYDAALRYREEGVPLVVLAGKEYGSGSSRDWAAKGTALLGVRAVVAESFERIHRSNLVGMGVLPLQLPPGETLASLGLNGHEQLAVTGLAEVPPGEPLPRELTLQADDREIRVRLRIDTPREAEYFRHGGILPFVLRALRDATS